MEVERKVIAVCCIVGVLGLISAATGLAAEAKRVKADQVQYPSTSECIYPRSPALGLGLTAASALMIAKIILYFETGCVCCRKEPHQSHSNWILALVCFVVSWLTFATAFILLLTGAAFHDQHGPHGGENLYFGSYYCYIVKPGVFAGGAVLSFVTVILGIIYYLNLTLIKNKTDPYGASVLPTQSGVAMGQPQFPSQNPVFVHEDTYMRRQFT